LLLLQMLFLREGNATSHFLA
jgi:hypothetical protein